MMADTPPTRASLLVRLRDPRDGEAWSQFVDLYAPLVFSWARGRGLQDADAADLTQEVLRATAAALPKHGYDPAKGAFRGWLYTVTRNKLNTFLTRQGRAIRGSGDSEMQQRLEEIESPEDEQRWQHEYHSRLINWAGEQVRGEFSAKTWRAFWMTAVEGKSGDEAADELSMSVGAVYVARSRVVARLRAVVRQALEDGETIGG
jgi:RNA polymerase sigma-70 factor (ECF subfamily)